MQFHKHIGEYKGSDDESQCNANATYNDTKEHSQDEEQNLHTDVPQASIYIKLENKTWPINGFGEPVHHNLLHPAVIK